MTCVIFINIRNNKYLILSDPSGTADCGCLANGDNVLKIKETFRVNRQLSELYRDHDVYISPLPGLKFNDFVRISYMSGRRKKRSIYVWLRFIDDYYKTFYNSVTDKRFNDPELLIGGEHKSIVLCKHYRVKLELPDNSLDSINLEIKSIRNPFKKIKALYNAPDSIMRTTTVISIISILMGIIALVLGVLSLR